MGRKDSMRKDTPKYVIQLAKGLRKEQTEAENLLWKHLKNNKLNNNKFRRQYPIGRYIADYYCIKKSQQSNQTERYIIELTGKNMIQLDSQKLKAKILRYLDLKMKKL